MIPRFLLPLFLGIAFSCPVHLFAKDSVPPGKRVKASGGKALLENFESGGVTNLLGGVWQVEQDGHKLGTKLKNKDKFIVKGGPNGSRNCARIHGHFGKNVAPWPFTSIYTSLDAQGPADLSSFKAIEFMAKGNGKTYDVLIYLSQVADFAHYRHPFKAPANWAKVRLEFRDFKQPDWGVKVKRDYRSVKQVLFAPSGMNDEDFDLSLDDITFVK
jgi:hypothetical protein